MTEQNHNFEIETALLHFQSALDGTVINRYAGDWSDPNNGLTNRSTEQRINVNYVFGPKQRIISDLEGKTDTVKFPIVAICPTGMGRDDARIKNKNDNIRIKLPDGNYGNYQVVPWNINVSVTIMTRFQEDMTQIISNFAVLSNPYFVFSWKEPKTGLDVRAEVYYDGQMAMEYPGASSDLPPNSPFRTMGTANFVIKTYLYRTEIDNTAKICKIDTDIIVPNKFYCNYDLLSDPENINGIDEYTTLGKPQLWYVDNYYFKSGDSPTVLIQGDGFALTEAIYVSGSNPNMYDMKDYDVNGFKFKGQLVDKFELLDAQNIQFNLPSPSSFGFVDVIITNDCGYGLLTEGANRCSRVENPYKPTDPKYTEWRVLQFPFLNGLIVSSDLNSPVSVNLNDTIIIYSPEMSSQDTLTSCSPTIFIRKSGEAAYDTVYSLSAFWTDAYLNLRAFSADYLEMPDLSLSSNWNSVYTVVQDNSAQWAVDTNDGDLNVNAFVYSNSADLLDVDIHVRTYSSDWLESFTNLITFSADYLFTDLTSIQSFTSNWNNSFTEVSSNSAFWSSAYMNLVANSALYLIDDTVDISELQSTSSFWNSSYNTVMVNSANWQDAFNNLITNSAAYLVDTIVDISDLASASAFWNSAYTNLITNSALYLEKANISEIQTISSIWNNITSVVQANSSVWAIDTNDGDLNVNSFVYSNSAKVLDTVSTVQEYSSLWILSGGNVDSETDPLFTTWAQTYSSLYDSAYNSTNVNSSLWQDAFNNLISNSAAYLVDNDTIVDISELQVLSSFWNSVYNTVNSGSANWNYQGLDIKSLTADWQETFGAFSTQSADNISVYDVVHSQSSNWQPGSAIFQTLSYDEDSGLLLISDGNTVSLSSLSGGGSLDSETDPLFTTWAQTYSALYQSNYDSVNQTSAFWVAAYNNLTTNSALYLIDNTVNITELQTASSFWNSVYTTVNSGSANWNYQGTDIKSLTADWQEAFVNLFTFSADYLAMTDISDIVAASASWNSTYNTVNTNSSVWDIPDNAEVNSFVWTQSADILDNINTVQTNSAAWGSGGTPQTLSFNEGNAELSIAFGNTISLSALSGGGSGVGTNIIGNIAYNRWQFTGAPPISAFNIVGNNSETEEAFRITIDAVVQDTINYSISSEYVIFSEAPPVSSNIVVIETYIVPDESPLVVQQYQRWAHTGNNIISAFDISGAMLSDRFAYKVTVDYLLQDPLSYTIDLSTSDLIFSESPPLSSEIIIIEQYHTTLTAVVSSFTTPVTASGDFLILRVNNIERAIRLWDF